MKSTEIAIIVPLIEYLTEKPAGVASLEIAQELYQVPFAGTPANPPVMTPELRALYSVIGRAMRRLGYVKHQSIAQNGLMDEYSVTYSRSRNPAFPTITTIKEFYDSPEPPRRKPGRPRLLGSDPKKYKTPAQSFTVRDELEAATGQPRPEVDLRPLKERLTDINVLAATYARAEFSGYALSPINGQLGRTEYEFAVLDAMGTPEWTEALARHQPKPEPIDLTD